MTITTIYVSLRAEAVPVWRPIEAEHIKENIYRILDQPYDSEVEEWEFVPNDRVFCEIIATSEGRVLAATDLFEE